LTRLAKTKVDLKAVTIVGQRVLTALITTTVLLLIMASIMVEIAIISSVLSLRLVVIIPYFLDMEIINLRTKINTPDPTALILIFLDNAPNVLGRTHHQKGSTEYIYYTEY